MLVDTEIQRLISETQTRAVSRLTDLGGQGFAIHPGFVWETNVTHNRYPGGWTHVNTSVHMYLPNDEDDTLSWYEKALEGKPDVTADRVQFVAEAEWEQDGVKYWRYEMDRVKAGIIIHIPHPAMYKQALRDSGVIQTTRSSPPYVFRPASEAREYVRCHAR